MSWWQAPQYVFWTGGFLYPFYYSPQIHLCFPITTARNYISAVFKQHKNTSGSKWLSYRENPCWQHVKTRNQPKQHSVRVVLHPPSLHTDSGVREQLQAVAKPKPFFFENSRCCLRIMIVGHATKIKEFGLCRAALAVGVCGGVCGCTWRQ